MVCIAKGNMLQYGWKVKKGEDVPMAIKRKFPIRVATVYCNGGCRAVALALTGDKLGVDPSKCLFWSRDYDRRIAERLPGYDNGTPVLSRTF